LPLRAPPSTNSDEAKASPGSSREDRCRECAPGQVSWLSDRPTPRAFPASQPVAIAGFVPDYSDGVAADSHRLPWVSHESPGTSNGEKITVTPPWRKLVDRLYKGWRG